MELESDSLTLSKLLRPLVSPLKLNRLLCLKLHLYQICVPELVVLEVMLILRFPVEMERQTIYGSAMKELRQCTSTPLARILQIGSHSMADSLWPRNRMASAKTFDSPISSKYTQTQSSVSSIHLPESYNLGDGHQNLRYQFLNFLRWMLTLDFSAEMEGQTTSISILSMGRWISTQTKYAATQHVGFPKGWWLQVLASQALVYDLGPSRIVVVPTTFQLCESYSPNTFYPSWTPQAL